jgi:Outer membrane protein beta-barrel domain
MRFKFSLLVLFAVVSITAQAQTVYLKSHLGVGIGAGSSFTTLSPNFIYALKFQTHPNMRVFYRIRKNKFVFQPEIQLNVKGGTFSGETAVIRNNFNYLSIQPVVGYILTEGLTLEAGAEFGKSINGPASYGTNKASENSLMLGARIDFLDFAEDFSFNFRYIYGLTDLSPIASQTMYNRTLQVTAIYNFYRKK